MCIEGNELCSARSAPWNTAARRWSIRSKGFVLAALRSSGEGGEPLPPRAGSACWQSRALLFPGPEGTSEKEILSPNRA